MTAAAGFRAAGVAAGVKEGEVPDVAIVASVPGTLAAAVFTLNRAAAAPVILSRAHMATGPEVRAVVLNSGCANAATGDTGYRHAVSMAETTAASLDCDPSEVLVCSTGPIGSVLPIGAVEAGIRKAAGQLTADEAGGSNAAEAILTTDSGSKQAVRSGGGITVGGMAKGAGMIRPDMATMLAVITTDAVVDITVLDGVLRSAVDDSFHALDVDGCPSTNDTVLLLASGASGTTVDSSELGAMVTAVAQDLAYQIAADAEGASRVVTVHVTGAVDRATANALGRAVADSVLVRSAFHGGDPNWGRIVAALGATDLPYDPDLVSVWFDGTQVAAGGCGLPVDEDALVARLANGDFTVTIAVGDGTGDAKVLTTDLTPDYVRFNAERS